MAYNQPQSQEGWERKEKRQMFVDKVGAFIIKCGSEKEPDLEKIFQLAKQIVDKAFEVYPPPRSDRDEIGDPDLPVIEGQ